MFVGPVGLSDYFLPFKPVNSPFPQILTLITVNCNKEESNSTFHKDQMLCLNKSQSRSTRFHSAKHDSAQPEDLLVCVQGHPSATEAASDSNTICIGVVLWQDLSNKKQ